MMLTALPNSSGVHRQLNRRFLVISPPNGVSPVDWDIELSNNSLRLSVQTLTRETP